MRARGANWDGFGNARERSVVASQEDLLHLLSDRSRLNGLLRFGYLLTGSEADSADLLQDALARLWSRPRQATDVENLEAFIKKTMTRLQLNRARRERRWRDLRRLLLPKHEESPEDQVAHDDLVARALNLLTPSQRAAFSLRFFDDLTVKEIAEILGCSVGGVKRHLADARRRLAAGLKLDERMEQK